MICIGNIWRNAANTVIFSLLALNGALLHAGALTPESQLKNEPILTSAQVTPRGTSSKAVYSVYIESRDCANGLEKALMNADIKIGLPGEEVDVILSLKLKQKSAWYTHWAPLDDYLQGIWVRASYEAKLIGNKYQVLLSLHGEERALSGRELCQDIGDKLADRLTQRD